MASKPEPQKSLTDRLIASLQQDEYVLYAQLIIPIAPQNGERPFQEIFIRFKEEDAKLLPPGSFFPILEECHLLPYLDRWVVNQLARWVRGALSNRSNWQVPRSNVNLSAQTLVDPELGKYVRTYVDDSCLSNGALGFEIAWDDAIEHQESLRRLMAELRPHGCSFALTDFDGSEPSFAMLKTFAPHFVKISSAAVNPETLAEINHQCHLLECKTIIEHVENEKLLEHMRLTKVDFGQGFEISPVQPL